MEEKSKQLLQFNEMSMAWVDVRAKRCVWVENPNTHENDYFKYLNNFSYKKANAVACLSMKAPIYLNNVYKDGKDTWVLTNKEKKELVDLMNSPSEARKGFTNWQATIIQYNFDNFYIQPEESANGTFNKKKFPNAYDINTPMPNYLELSNIV